MIAGHNLLDGVRSAHPLWAILHAPGFVVEPAGIRGVRGVSADSVDRRHRRSATGSGQIYDWTPSAGGRSCCASAWP